MIDYTPSEVCRVLPDKRYYEYIYHKFYNPGAEYADWQPWDEWNYPEQDILRFGYLIANNIDVIKGQRVLDVACHLGYISLFCAYVGALSVTGTNVRDRELELSRELCSVAGYSNCQFVNLNLYDFKNMAEQLDQHDTIILSGILYHINNHYQLLELVTNSKIKNIIIESEVTDDVDNVVRWKHELSAASINGYTDSVTDNVLVGTPSVRFIVDALNHFGWEITKQRQFEMITSKDRSHPRVVITATR